MLHSLTLENLTDCVSAKDVLRLRRTHTTQVLYIYPQKGDRRTKRVVSGIVEAHLLFMFATAIHTLISPQLCPSLGANPCPVAGCCRKC